MVVFCPNCGTQNAGLAGVRATCTACQSTFDVPADAARPPLPAAAPPPATGYSAPGAQVFSPPPGAAPIRQTTGTKTNILAVVSLVAGVVCCVPFVSPGVAIGCGIGAIKQIDASPNAETGRGLAIAGIILGAITALMQFFWLVGVISRGR